VIFSVANSNKNNEVDEALKQGTPKKDSKMNQVYCLGFAGKLLTSAIKAEVGKISEVYKSLHVTLRILRGMEDGDITFYKMEDIEKICTTLSWKLVTKSDKKGYSIKITTPKEEYRIDDFWNSDQEEVQRLLKQRDEKE